jgi:GPH family glycoside/pentoside/hexuronide:cation symporter
MSSLPVPSAATSAVRWPEKVSYAVGDTACCLFWVIVSSYLNKFYTDVFGLAPAALGLMLLITRIWDAAFDPVMGMIADRTSTRWGKFRPWILWSIVPFIAAEIALFYTPDFGPTGKLVYAYVTYSLMMLIYSVVNVPYGALLGVITPHSEERTALASYRFVGAFAGNFIVQGTLLAMVHHFGRGDNRLGYLIAVTILAFASGLLFFGLFLGTKERIRPPQVRSSVATDLKDLVRNRPWVTLFVLGALSLIYLTSRQTVILYYFDYYVGNEALSSAFLLAGTVCSILGAVLAPFLVKWIGDKRRAFMLFTIAGALFHGLTYLARPGDVVMIFALHMLSSIPMAAIFPLMGSMYADTADYGEWKFGRRATGLVFAGSTFSQKTGGALGAGLVNVILALVGYVPNVAQTAESVQGIRHMMSTIPAAGALVVVALTFLYPLTGELERRVGRELASRPGRDLGGAPATA